MAKWEARDVKCPFYRGLTENQISCEGLEKGSVIRLDFGAKEKRREHQAAYCNSIKNYSKCRLATMLMGKYGYK